MVRLPESAESTKAATDNRMNYLGGCGVLEEVMTLDITCCSSCHEDDVGMFEAWDGEDFVEYCCFRVKEKKSIPWDALRRRQRERTGNI